MRSRVESNWRTRLLLLLAFIAAGVIAYHRVNARLSAQASEAPEPPAGDVVEVEIVAE